MRGLSLKRAGALSIIMELLMAAQIVPQPAAAAETAHGHSHEHGSGDAVKDAVSKGYFEDSQVKDRSLTDWEGNWQSLYPYLQDGTLDPVLAHKAEAGDKTADEYRAYYEAGYKTDVSKIVIAGDTVTFHRGDKPARAKYVTDGHEILTYKKGNKGVRYIFKKMQGDDGAPRFIQFSDHGIAPAKAGHFHLYWGDDRSALLKQMDNWPTYYPSALSGDQIVHEMLAH